MKKVIKIILGLIGVTTIIFFVKKERRTIKNLRRNINELNEKKMS